MRHLQRVDVAVAAAVAMLALGGCASPRAPASSPDVPSRMPSSASPAATGEVPSSSDPPRAGGGSQARGSGAGPSLPQGAAQTADERVAAIDRRLDDSLGTFDAQLRKEQERLAKERDARQGNADATVAGDPGGVTDGAFSSDDRSDGSGSSAAEGSEQDARGNAGVRRGGSQRRSAHAGDLKSEKSAGSGARNDNAGNGATARNIPDGSDDDVVARRLRRAAEQETDPELKDKLWKEYIDYKNNAGK